MTANERWIIVLIGTGTHYSPDDEYTTLAEACEAFIERVKAGVFDRSLRAIAIETTSPGRMVWLRRGALDKEPTPDPLVCSRCGKLVQGECEEGDELSPCPTSPERTATAIRWSAYCKGEITWDRPRTRILAAVNPSTAEVTLADEGGQTNALVCSACGRPAADHIAEGAEVTCGLGVGRVMPLTDYLHLSAMGSLPIPEGGPTHKLLPSEWGPADRLRDALGGR